jgi:hypothetical protein
MRNPLPLKRWNRCFRGVSATVAFCCYSAEFANAAGSGPIASPIRDLPQPNEAVSLDLVYELACFLNPLVLIYSF